MNTHLPVTLKSERSHLVDTYLVESEHTVIHAFNTKLLKNQWHIHKYTRIKNSQSANKQQNVVKDYSWVSKCAN